MKLELVSFDLCPFVQRSIITLLYKNVEHSITYIDLDAPPAWFVDISPLGKVPLLKAGDTVLFESAAINEFIDEITGDPMMPTDPTERARNRAWIAFSSDLLSEQYRLTLAKDEDSFQAARKAYCELLDTLENNLADGPFFNGNKLSLVDTAFAPIVVREQLLGRYHPIMRAADFPRYRAWGSALLALPEVTNSVIDNFTTRFTTHFATRNSFALNH